MSIGMTFDQYWDGPADLVRYFRDAFELKMRRQNRLLHLQGAYIYDILTRVAPAYRTFSKTPAQPYRDTVIPFTEGEYRDIEQQEKQKKLDATVAHMKSMMEMINKRRHADGRT